MGGWPGGLPVLPGRLTWNTNRLEYLGIYLGSDNTMTRNWEGMMHWLLKEPLVCGGRLDISCDALPGLTGVLRHSGVVTLQRLLEVAGPALNDVQTLGSVLGIRSTWWIQRRWGCGGGSCRVEQRASYSGGPEEKPNLTTWNHSSTSSCSQCRRS